MITEQDMAELIYIHDAYNAINNVLFENGMVLSFYEGNWGALSRIFRLIERNAADELKKDDYKNVCEILNNISISPEARAKLLLMK